MTFDNSLTDSKPDIFNKVSTDDLQTTLTQPDVMLLDVRSADAYNGWPLQGESRGGHISGAKSLPAKWSKYLDWLEIVQSKGITPNQSIILYGYDAAETEAVARQFYQLGFRKLSVYHDFVAEWSSRSELPMDHLPRYKHLVPAEWLKTLLDGEKPADIKIGNAPVLCHAHYQNPADYEAGHIPGAIALDTLVLESEETWNRRTPPELELAMQSLGITADTPVIVYGRFSYPKFEDPFPGSSAGHLGAIRCAAILMYAGVKDVRILNGGIQAWEDAGYELTTVATIPQPVHSFGAPIPGRPELFKDIPEAKELLKADDGVLVSVRSWPEFIGETSGYHYIEKKGRIPGAVFGNCGSDAYHMENYRNPDHTTREYHEIVKLWKEVGITPDKRVAFYCGTGWRGSEAFLNAWVMAWPDVAVFDGGWFEWSNDPANPTETGIPPTG